MSINPYDELGAITSEVYQYDQEIRSHAIYKAVAIESDIEQIIAWHFCHDESKHILFISLMFNEGQITFSQKLAILKKLLRDSYSDIYLKYSGIFSQLDKIRELRNKLAHTKIRIPYEYIYPMRATTDRPQKGLYLEYYKDGKVINEFIPAEKVKEIMEKARVLEYFLDYLHMEIKNRALGKYNSNFKLAVESLNRLHPGILPKPKK